MKQAGKMKKRPEWDCKSDCVTAYYIFGIGDKQHEQERDRSAGLESGVAY